MLKKGRTVVVTSVKSGADRKYFATVKNKDGAILKNSVEVQLDPAEGPSQPNSFLGERVHSNRIGTINLYKIVISVSSLSGEDAGFLSLNHGRSIPMICRTW